MKQLNAELCFELDDVLAQRRLSNSDRSRGRGKGTGFRDDQEVSKLTDVHVISPPCFNELPFGDPGQRVPPMSCAVVPSAPARQR